MHRHTIRWAHWSITGKCNLRCRHCYLSAAEAKYGEVSTEMALNIVAQLSNMGIRQISLTGGEPLVRGDFWEIVDAAREQGVAIRQIYTNGVLVNGALLDEFGKRGMKPQFVLSYDGVGRHDWLRGVEGAEQAAIDAIRLLTARGFRVSVSSSIHRGNVETLGDTMRLLAELGVENWKCCPMAGAGDWLKEDRSLDLGIDELYEAYLKLIPEYLAAGSPLGIEMAGLFSCGKGGRDYKSGFKMDYEDAEKRACDPLCKCVNSVMYISADARMLPCMPMAGLPVQDEFPSLYDTSIYKALTNSFYLKCINATLRDLFDSKPECAACPHRLHCGGGCRAYALAGNGADYLGVDGQTCRFFKGGYGEKVKNVVETFAAQRINIQKCTETIKC